MTTFTNKSLIIIFCSIVLFSCTYKDARPPEVEQGVLDLSTWDGGDDGTVKLNGTCEFYWQQLLEPADFEKETAPAKTGWVRICRPWNGFLYDNKPIGAHGYATYRLRIKLKEGQKNYALYFYQKTPYRVFVNNKELASFGTISKTKQTGAVQPSPTTIITDFYTETDEVEIVIQASNFVHRLGGMRSSILFGDKESIRKKRERRLFGDFFLFGGLVIVGLYHFGLFWLRKKEYAPLFLAIYCCLFALRILFEGEMYFNTQFSFMNIEVFFKANYLSYYLLLPIFNLFLYCVYPRVYSRFVMYVVFALTAIASAVVLVFPVNIFSYTLSTVHILTAVNCSYAIYVLITAFIKKEQGALITLVGFLLFFILIINDLLYNNYILRTGTFAATGLFLFILCQAYLLSQRSAKAFSIAEHLTEKLGDEVKKQTLILEEKTEQAILSKKEIETLNEQRMNFFINLTHETKTPVTLVKNYVEMHIKNHGTSGELDIAYRNALELERNMDNYMQIEKAAATENKLFNHDAVCNLTKMIQDVSRLYPAGMICLDLDENVLIKANPAAVKRVLDNILINAVKYNTEHVKITINVKAGPEKVVLQISDDGVGIPEEQQQSIFDPFYQLLNPKKNIQGIGLGLSMVKAIIDSMQGTLELVSKENEGVTFIITCDRYHGPEEQHEEVTGDIIMSAPLMADDKRVIEDTDYVPEFENLLLVEDKKDILQLLKSNFEDEFNVYTAENGKKALEKINTLYEKECLPRVIISDIMMDEMDGYEFLRTIREDRRFEYIPVIFLTAKTSGEDEKTGFEAGAVTYITKPFSIDTLKAAVKANIETRDSLLDEYETSRYTKNSFEQKCNEYGLTKIQQKIIKYWIIDDHSQSKIAELQGTSVRMIEKHVAAIKKRVGLTGKQNTKGHLKNIFHDFL